jgi:alpha-galactosidase/6-phospho-beta-glucosidase family protein
VIDEQELALEAAMTGSFDTAVRAIACDPLVMSLTDARELARDLIALEEAHLGRAWDSYWATTP